MRTHLVLAACALMLVGCVQTIGPFVSDIHRSDDVLVVRQCMIEKTGDQLSRGACRSRHIKVKTRDYNRGPKYLYLPNSEVGEVRLKRRDDKATMRRTASFEYVAAPGLVFSLKVHLQGDSVLRDTASVGITLDRMGDDQLTGATKLVLLVDGKPSEPMYLDWKRRQNGELTRETLRHLVSARQLVHNLEGIRNLELQFGDRQYALPSRAIFALNSYTGYVKARLPTDISAGSAP